MTDLLISIVEHPTTAESWMCTLWSSSPDSGRQRLAGGDDNDSFTKADLEAALPNGDGKRDAVLDKIRNQDAPHPVFREIGERLHDMLAKAGIAAAWRAQLATADRTYLQLPKFVEDWPWELLALPNPPGYPKLAFTSPKHPVMRVPRDSLPIEPMTECTVRILLVSGQEDLDPANPGKEENRASTELRRIRKIFQNANQSVVVDLCEAPTLDALEERISVMAPHILHIIAHGNIQDGLGFALELRKPQLPIRRWSAREIQDSFDNLAVPKPRLVILNSCNSAQRDASSIPVTDALLAAGIPAVVGSIAALQIDYARYFSDAFYSALASGESIDKAMVSARGNMTKKESYGPDTRHWALPVLTARAPVQDLLRFTATRVKLDTCELAHDVFRRPGAFVNRACDRWSMLSALQETTGAAKRFRGLIVLGNSQVGKSWLVMRAMRDFFDSGILVRYATLVGAGSSRTSLDVLQEWRGRPNFNSPVLSPLPKSEADFAAFDAALAKATAPGGFTAGNISEALRTFKAGFQSYRGNKTVLLVLGRFRQAGLAHVAEPDFRENLMEKLLLPLRAVKSQDPETEGLCCVLIVRERSDTQSVSDFEFFGLNRLSDTVQPEERRQPEDGFKRLTLSEFSPDEVDRHLDEFTQFKDTKVVNDLRILIKSVITETPRPTWSPMELQEFEKLVDRRMKTP